MPSVADVSRPEWDRNPVLASGNPSVSIIVPARNEEETIQQALHTLLALDYDKYEVIAVNDRSTDRTGELMESVSKTSNASANARMTHPLRVIHHNELPPGWLGKTHAMWTAANQASGDWLLFTDADVLFKPDSLRRALAYAEAEHADHVVLFPRMIMKRPGEYMMIAFFQTMFMFGHRPWKVADPSTDDHMGVGAFNLVRRRAYDAVGTYQALRMEVLGRYEIGQSSEAGWIRSEKRVWWRPDLDSLGARRDGRRQQSNEEFLCRALVSIMESLAVGVWTSLFEPRTLSRNLVGARLGADSIRCRPAFHVHDLHRNVVAVFGSSVLFPTSSDQHGAFHLHAASLNLPHTLEQRNHLEGDEVSAGRIAQRNGLVRPVLQPFFRMRTSFLRRTRVKLSAQRRRSRCRFEVLRPRFPPQDLQKRVPRVSQRCATGQRQTVESAPTHASSRPL